MVSAVATGAGSGCPRPVISSAYTSSASRMRSATSSRLLPRRPPPWEIGRVGAPATVVRTFKDHYVLAHLRCSRPLALGCWSSVPTGTVSLLATTIRAFSPGLPQTSFAIPSRRNTSHPASRRAVRTSRYFFRHTPTRAAPDARSSAALSTTSARHVLGRPEEIQINRDSGHPHNDSGLRQRDALEVTHDGEPRRHPGSRCGVTGSTGSSRVAT